jgi:hypothetical protein
MAQLVDWAHDAFDFTINQGVKPSLLYVINQDSHSDFAKWADVEFATAAIMEKLRKSKRFEEEQTLWTKRGERVETADQLLKCYYSQVKVVFIPQFLPDTPMCEAQELKRQYKILYKEINDLSLLSSTNREAAGILFDVETLSRNSSGVLEELAKDFTTSVDLHRLAEPFQTYPTNFKTHVLNILSRLQELSPETSRGFNHSTSAATTPSSEVSLIKRNINYLAHCIAGEIVRTPCK